MEFKKNKYSEEEKKILIKKIELMKNWLHFPTRIIAKILKIPSGTVGFWYAKYIKYRKE